MAEEQTSKTETTSAKKTQTNLYPHLVVENNKKPNRWYAFPLIALMVKLIFLLPVFIELMFLYIFGSFVLVINWFIILFTGKYWNFAYRYFLGVMRLDGKVRLFIWGITDQYPGFTFTTKGIYTLEIAKPEKPNRLLSFPFVGVLLKVILLIPYLIFSEVMDRGSGIAMIISWFAVLFKKRFPESLYEFEKDSLRVSFATSSYLLSLSDTYPSFSISMNHQTVKILLIIAGSILTVWNTASSFMPQEKTPYDVRYDQDSRFDMQYRNDSQNENDYMIPEQEDNKIY